ncbi:10926_t:CDS:2, partial [Dentiscutata heterogama]
VSVTPIDVTEINNLILDPVNYCLFNSSLTGKMVNPISIRPLKQQFVLVSYLNKISDNNYEEWGTVLNWKGENLSSILLESSISSLEDHQILIEININKELGFLGAAIKKNSSSIAITQYSVDVNGALSARFKNYIRIGLFINATFFTSLATVDEGYAILYAKYSVNRSDFMSSLGGLYVSFIDYNTTNSSSIGNPILLFQITKAEMKINAVPCNAYFGFAAIIGSGQLFNTPNETSMPWNVVSSTPVGGYIFSAVVNTACLIYIYDFDRHTKNIPVNLTTTGICDAYSILKNNNTLLFSLRNINDKNTSWSLLAVQLPETPN